MGENKRNLFSI